MTSFFKQAFQRKMLSSDGSDAQTAGQDALLKKSLGLFDLIGFGIAAIIGAGIFSTIGTASYQGGPAVILLFLAAAVVCAFSGLAYAEFASMVKGSGSSYTYTAISLGELPAWLIGWAIIAEYALICIVVAISWSSYLVGFLDGINVVIPEYLRVSYTTTKESVAQISNLTNAGTVESLGKITEVMKHQQQAWDTAPMIAGFRFIINLPAIIIVALLSALAYRGIHESKTVSHAMVAVKLGVIALILLVGTGYINSENYTPFMPNGFGGLTQSISAVFFAYIGFDVITATAAECKNPQKDLPRGILWSIGICTLLYILIALVVTGMVSYTELNHGDPLAFVFEQLAKKEQSQLLAKFSQIIALSALCATTSVILVFQLGQPRIWVAMARDGLLPKRFANIHPTFKTPSFSTFIAALLVLLPIVFSDMKTVTDMSSMGALSALSVVCFGLVRLQTNPQNELKPTVKIPYLSAKIGLFPLLLIALYVQPTFFLSFTDLISSTQYIPVIFWWCALFGMCFYSLKKEFSFIPAMGCLSALLVLSLLGLQNWIMFGGWLAIGLAIYVFYGSRNSYLKK